MNFLSDKLIAPQLAKCVRFRTMVVNNSNIQLNIHRGTQLYQPNSNNYGHKVTVHVAAAGGHVLG